MFVFGLVKFLHTLLLTCLSLSVLLFASINNSPDSLQVEIYFGDKISEDDVVNWQIPGNIAGVSRNGCSVTTMTQQNFFLRYFVLFFLHSFLSTLCPLVVCVLVGGVGEVPEAGVFLLE